MDNLHFIGRTKAGGRLSALNIFNDYYVTRNAEIYRIRTDKPDVLIPTKTYPTSRNRRNSIGYLAVSTKNLPDKYLHRIMAKVFIPNDDPLNKTDIDHLDGNKHNNQISNLEWVSKSENQKRMHARLRAEGNVWTGRRKKYETN